MQVTLITLDGEHGMVDPETYWVDIQTKRGRFRLSEKDGKLYVHAGDGLITVEAHASNAVYLFDGRKETS